MTSTSTRRSTGSGRNSSTWSYYAKGPLVAWLIALSTGALGHGEWVADYVAALERRDGPEVTRQRIMLGPAHALIFPNLFLGETNVAIVEPVHVEECVHWHTPMFWTGVPQFNRRLLRMAEARRRWCW